MHVGWLYFGDRCISLDVLFIYYFFNGVNMVQSQQGEPLTRIDIFSSHLYFAKIVGLLSRILDSRAKVFQYTPYTLLTDYIDLYSAKYLKIY